jgi:muramoyltetrapeptide carboxypeptidase LdcA involved in peptidoglycan recycling
MRTKPPALPDGGRIAVVAPSSPPQIRSEIEQATDYFTKLGYGHSSGTPYVGSSLSIEEILDELIAPLGIPAIANVPVGHGKHMATIPLGTRARIDADAKTLEIVEPGVA